MNDDKRIETLREDLTEALRGFWAGRISSLPGSVYIEGDLSKLDVRITDCDDCMTTISASDFVSDMVELMTRTKETDPDECKIDPETIRVDGEKVEVEPTEDGKGYRLDVALPPIPRKCFIDGVEVSLDENTKVIDQGNGRLLLTGKPDPEVATIRGRLERAFLAMWNDDDDGECRRERRLDQIYTECTSPIGETEYDSIRGTANKLVSCLASNIAEEIRNLPDGTAPCFLRTDHEPEMCKCATPGDIDGTPVTEGDFKCAIPPDQGLEGNGVYEVTSAGKPFSDLRCKTILIPTDSDEQANMTHEKMEGKGEPSSETLTEVLKRLERATKELEDWNDVHTKFLETRNKYGARADESLDDFLKRVTEVTRDDDLHITFERVEQAVFKTWLDDAAEFFGNWEGVGIEDLTVVIDDPNSSTCWMADFNISDFAKQLFFNLNAPPPIQDSKPSTGRDKHATDKDGNAVNVNGPRQLLVKGEKPPLGAVPKNIWQLNRLEELRGAIARNLGHNRISDSMMEWCGEYQRLRKDLERTHQYTNENNADNETFDNNVDDFLIAIANMRIFGSEE